jgi:regulatory protein
MIITAIQQQVRDKGRYSIFVDEEYVFSLSAESLLEGKLHVGQAIESSQLEDYKKLSADDKAYHAALAYAARRLRSEYEFTLYFRRKGVDEPLAQYIMRKLERLGFVNDQKFAEAWARNRRSLKLASRNRLVQELRQKGIHEEVINLALSEEESDERAVLRELIERRRRQPKYQDNTKLMQYLARQGFSYDDIATALK